MQVVVPDDVVAYGEIVAATLVSALGDDLVGVWFVGSVALDGYVPHESDVDIFAVCRDRLDHERRSDVATRLLATTAQCPARGLELTLHRQEVAAARAFDADYEINVNGGPRMDECTRLAPDDNPTFWWVIDRAVAHRHGVTIAGPSSRDVVADVPRSVLLDAMVESMRWHRQHEPASLYSVLNACRAWHFAAEDRLVNKLAGAAWAKERWHDVTTIDAAVALRLGRPARLDAGAVDDLLDHVERQLTLG